MSVKATTKSTKSGTARWPQTRRRKQEALHSLSTREVLFVLAVIRSYHCRTITYCAIALHSSSSVVVPMTALLNRSHLLHSSKMSVAVWAPQHPESQYF
jgi:hypothetical protein